MPKKSVGVGGVMLLSVSCPGGMAKQYRVQVCDTDSPNHWSLAGSFRNPSDAGACTQRLMDAGRQARIVECRSLPTAA